MFKPTDFLYGLILLPGTILILLDTIIVTMHDLNESVEGGHCI